METFEETWKTFFPKDDVPNLQLLTVHQVHNITSFFKMATNNIPFKEISNYGFSNFFGFFLGDELKVFNYYHTNDKCFALSKKFEYKIFTKNTSSNESQEIFRFMKKKEYDEEIGIIISQVLHYKKDCSREEVIQAYEKTHNIIDAILMLVDKKEEKIDIV